MTRRARFQLGALFVLSFALCCFAAGTWLGAIFFVPNGSGLAGPAIAAGYGVLGAIAGGLAATWLAFCLPRPWLARLVVPSALLAALVLIFIVVGYRRSQSELSAHLEEAYARLPPFHLELELVEMATPSPFAKIVFEKNAQYFRVTTSAAAGCRVPLSGVDTVAVLTALRNVEGLLLRTPGPCGAQSAVKYRLDFDIEEAKPPDSRGNFAIGRECLDRHAELRDLVATLERVYRQNKRGETCE